MIYKKIATELKARINSDDYAVGDMLPSEKALAAELQVSVMTLRKALALLEEEKLIARRHGSGTCIVRKSNYHGGELEGFNYQMQVVGFNYQMQVVGVTNYRNKVIEFTLLDAPPAIAQQLKIQPGEKVYYVRRLRLIDEVPILVENSYIPYAAFPWLSVGNLEQSKFNYFKKECHITIIESHRSYTPVLATREQAELLQVAPNSLLLRVQSVSYAQNRAIVDFSEIYQNTSKYNVKHITRR
ncbi:GntR family transcriptional regulator [Klebsiella quasipneumoniae]|uniref:GntR family transcriptional regulator n=1 Tax=Klebsiella quasipneumoniae TaxID=1463165 RepID=UPI00300DF965